MTTPKYVTEDNNTDWALMSIPWDFIWATSFSSNSDFYFEFVCMVCLCFGGTECSSVAHAETVSYLFNSSLLYILRYGFSLNLEYAVSVRLADEWVVCLPSPWLVPRLQIYTIMPGFYMGTGNSELWALPVDNKHSIHWTISLPNSGLLFSLSWLILYRMECSETKGLSQRSHFLKVTFCWPNEAGLL